jgi:hypothetical protein
MATRKPEAGKTAIKREPKMFTGKNSKYLICGLVLATSLGVGISRAVADDEDMPRDVPTTPFWRRH